VTFFADKQKKLRHFLLSRKIRPGRRGGASEAHSRRAQTSWLENLTAQHSPGSPRRCALSVRRLLRLGETWQFFAISALFAVKFLSKPKGTLPGKTGSAASRRRILCPAWLHRVGEGGVVDPADSLRVPPPEAMAWERFPLLSLFAPRSAAHLPYFTSRVSRQHFLLITPRRYCSAEGEVKAETQPSAVSGQPSGLKRTGDGRPETGGEQRKTIAGRWQRATGSD